MSPDEARRHLYDMLEKFDSAMLTTRAADGSPRARPMAISRVEKGGALYFVTQIDSPKVDEIQSDSDVLVTVQGDRRYVSLSGRAELVRDRQLIRDLWSPFLKTWFEDENDPSIVVLRVEPRAAEYWDNSGVRGIAFVFDAVKAMLGGDKGGGGPDTNQKVHL